MNDDGILLRPGLRNGTRPEKSNQLDRRRLAGAGRGSTPTGAGRHPFTWIRAPASRRNHLQAARSIPWLMSRLSARETASDVDARCNDALRARVLTLRRTLRRQGLTETLTIDSLGLVRAVVRRELAMEPHPEQLFAAWAMLHGSIVEMATGEGKTLTAGMVAVCAALAGVPVHVLTVNDYLVQRDAASLARLYDCFALATGVVTATMPDEQRRQGYAADIVHVSSKQIVFDYLRDGRTLGDQRQGLKHRLNSLLNHQCGTSLLRGLCLAIVDEADSVLIDDARTPLVLAEARALTDQERTEAVMALAIARSLKLDHDFVVQKNTRSASLTEAGTAALVRLSGRLSGRWQQARYRRERVLQALVALHVYQRDRHYLVADDAVLLIDESTGRTLPDRKLQHGLHQMLELKERCSMTAGNEVVAALSFQRFFTRYGMLCGMSGTVHGVRRELRRVYAVNVVRVPEHTPCRRRQFQTSVLPCRGAQLRELLHRVARCQRSGQPVLVGTRTVELSETVSALLDRQGIRHQLLNARQDAAEAGIVAQAGHRGAVTIATNMAGRGTDITLGAGVAELGGLHVINLEVNDSRRVDRQLFGRAARQGDPGSCEALLCLEDDTLQRFLPWPLPDIMDRLTPSRNRIGVALAALVMKRAQWRLERHHAHVRMALFRGREQQDRLLALAGDGD